MANSSETILVRSWPGETEIKTNIIGEYIMEALSNLDQVAYVRYASVYKNFREVKDFEDFLVKLEDK